MTEKTCYKGVEITTDYRTSEGRTIIDDVEVQGDHEGPCQRLALHIDSDGIEFVAEGNDGWLYAFGFIPNEKTYGILRFHRADSEEDRRDRQYLACDNEWHDLPEECHAGKFREWHWPDDALRLPFLPTPADQSDEFELEAR